MSIPTAVAVDVSRGGIRIAISEARVRAVVRAVCRREQVRDALISVAFIGKARMARMNRDFLCHTGATDVITFALDRGASGPSAGTILGDIYIAPEVARDNAKAHGVGVRLEITRLIVHGTLHVLGYTHEEDERRTLGEMWRRQERILAAIA
ncbi:MAG: rRNA maturation RNase YbeY [Gemmatimonadota bacterium]|nr:rRNA maturation RNase YbeY [Gemmatimonadota bacterium]